MTDTAAATAVRDHLVEDAVFRNAFRQVPAAVAVVLVRTGEGGITGLTCTSAGSLSGDPPMAMVGVDDKTGVMPLIDHARRFSINYLAADRLDVARAFSARGADVSALTSLLVPGRTPVTTLATGTTAVLECGLANSYRAGDHWIVCGTVLHARFQADVAPMVYHAGGYRTVETRGHERTVDSAVYPEGNSP